MDERLREQLLNGVASGEIVPYLGPGVLADVISPTTGAPIPATSEQMILAMNGGRPMAPKLMYEFSRAAMNVEFKRGRAAVTRFLNTTYGDSAWTRSALHDWLAALLPPYVVDINRDTQLLDSYAKIPHILAIGCARIGGSDFRYRLYRHDGTAYAPVAPDEIAETDETLPFLFKPMGSPRPTPSYIASDADYVDFITELMGGFAVPAVIKRRRRGKRYLLLGVRLNRDTERMVFSDIIYDAGEAPHGWAMIADATDKERRFLRKSGIELIEEDFTALTESNCIPHNDE